MSEIRVKQILPPVGGMHGAWRVAAIRVKGDLSFIFEFAVVRGLVEANPIPSLRGCCVCLPAKARRNDARANPEVLSGLAEIQGLSGTAPCLRLIALTACLLGEAAYAEWDEFDFEDVAWHLPAVKMKARREDVSPLSAQA